MALLDIKSIATDAGNITLFITRFFKEVLLPPYELKAFLKQCFEIGYKSLPLICITGFIMGLVLTLQARPTMLKFGAESWIPGMVSLSLIREIAPMVTALLCAGKIASSMGAELGSMKVSEQIDAMEVSGTNPYKYLVVTRVLAATLIIPLLVLFADATGIFGGYVGINFHGDVKIERYFTKVFEKLEFIDIVPAIIKTYFFGFFIAIIGCYKGYEANNGTESVGRAANEAVVGASLTIFFLDMIAVQITDLFY